LSFVFWKYLGVCFFERLKKKSTKNKRETPPPPPPSLSVPITMATQLIMFRDQLFLGLDIPL